MNSIKFRGDILETDFALWLGETKAQTNGCKHRAIIVYIARWMQGTMAAYQDCQGKKEFF